MREAGKGVGGGHGEGECPGLRAHAQWLEGVGTFWEAGIKPGGYGGTERALRRCELSQSSPAAESSGLMVSGIYWEWQRHGGGPMGGLFGGVGGGPRSPIGEWEMGK